MNRVERLIRESFLELLKTQSFYNIHVKDILQKEQISRTSFYKYYKDKYDLLDRIENDLLSDFDSYLEKIREQNPNAVFINGVPAETKIFAGIFAFANDHYDTLASLFGANGDGLFFDKVIRHISEKPYFLLDNEALISVFSENQWEFINSFLAYGYLGLIMNWLNQGKNRRNAKEMGDIMAGIVQGFFGNLSLFSLANLESLGSLDLSRLDLSKIDLSQLDLSHFTLKTAEEQTQD